MNKKIETIDAEELDRIFDEGKEDILQYFDTENAVRLGAERQKVNISLPVWMVHSLDREAERLDITRQAVIKLWIDEKLKSISA
jgi:phosphoribosylanthranilate isomerase